MGLLAALSTLKGKGGHGPTSDACLPAAPVPVQVGDGAMTPQLPWWKVGSSSTVSRREDVGTAQSFALR